MQFSHNIRAHVACRGDTPGVPVSGDQGGTDRVPQDFYRKHNFKDQET